jgi:hypothetical protein
MPFCFTSCLWIPGLAGGGEILGEKGLQGAGETPVHGVILGEHVAAEDDATDLLGNGAFQQRRAALLDAIKVGTTEEIKLRRQPASTVRILELVLSKFEDFVLWEEFQKMSHTLWFGNEDVIQ